MKDIRVAAVVLNSRVGETGLNLKRMADWVNRAHEKGVSMVCFPELSMTGYHPHREIEGFAEPVPGPSSDYLQGLSREENITILAGIAEARPHGRPFASHMVITPDGIAGLYRKLHLGPPERGIFTAGDTIPLFEAEGLKFGIQLCYDAHFPELSTRMALDGADAVFIPHASPGSTGTTCTTPKNKMASWIRHLPARAFDNGVFVIACNPCGKNGRGLSFPGVAMVIGPSGEVINSYAGDNEYMIIADLDACDLDRVRNHKMRYFLPNRRPEVY